MSKISKKDFDNWANTFFSGWANLNPEKSLSTLCKKVEYYETPFSEPCDSWDRVKELWKVVPSNQKDIVYDYDVVIIENGLGLIHWQLKRTLLPSNERQEIDGVFLVELNKDGLCTMFKQWRMLNS